MATDPPEAPWNRPRELKLTKDERRARNKALASLARRERELAAIAAESMEAADGRRLWPIVMDLDV